MITVNKQHERVGLLLAGGLGTRLFPLTQATNKHLLAVFDKPMIYYSLSLIMLAGIQEIIVVTSKSYLSSFKALLGTGAQWGIEIQYVLQEQPEGIPQAFTLAEKLTKGRRTMLVLGDNLLVGDGLADMMIRCSESDRNLVLASKVADPENYGILSDAAGKISLWEKPKNLKTGYAIPGIYFLDETAAERAKTLAKSKRGEYEIIDLLSTYNDHNELYYEKLGRGFAWLDAGSHERLLDASNYISILQRRQKILIGSPDEIAFRNSWISLKNLRDNTDIYKLSSYGKMLEIFLHQVTENNNT